MILSLELNDADKLHPMPNESTLCEWAKVALKECPKQPIALSISNANKTESMRLNKQFRQQDHATNVLSFPINETVNEQYYIGDIICCGEIIEDEARKQSCSAHDHWAHMVIHGLLHLQNYDHLNDTDAKIMESKEIAMLAQLNISNPYQQENNNNER